VSMGKDHGPSIQDDERYEALREEGVSKEKAARIAKTPPKEMKDRGGPGAYEDWTMEQLYDKAKDVGIEGRSEMSKAELIDALRG
jgi:Rho termination factor, N-terminal domain